LEEGVMKKSNDIDLSELIFTEIQYEVTEENMKSTLEDWGDEDAEMDLEAFHESLEKVVRIKVPRKDRKRLQDSIESGDVISDVWDWFTEQTGWVALRATILSKDRKPVL
jgi:hypothetical protein